MKRMNSKKGFTLIELLIVIAIIAVLAVAFLPTILNAPAKGRDTARIAALQKIQKVITSKTLEGKAYPNNAGPIKTDLVWKQLVNTDTDTWNLLLSDFGGALPAEPTQNRYFYIALGSTALGSSSYNFGLWAQVENLSTGNANCHLTTPWTITLGTPVAPTPAAPATATDVPCYAILAQ